jgi:CHAD domain-containing protein
MDPAKVTTRLKSSLRKKLRQAREQLKDPPTKIAGQPVHKARKSIKKLRALLRLARRMADKKRLRPVAAHLREAAHCLGPLRDAVVLRETVRGLKKREDPTPPPMEIGAPWGALHQARAQLRSADGAMRKLLASEWDTGGLEAGLRRLYKRSRNAMKRAAKSKSDDDLHTWRRRLKDLYYARKVLPNGGRTRVLVKRIKLLTSHLGHDHDLAFLQQHVLSQVTGNTHDALLRRAAKRRKPLQKMTFKVGRDLLHREAKAFTKNVSA